MRLNSKYRVLFGRIFQLKKPFSFAIVFFGIFGTLSIGYSALTAGLTTGDRVSSGAVLSSDSWNRIVNSVLELDARTSPFSSSGGNVGIGVTSPTAKLEVNGTVKATRLDSASGEIISIALAQCGGGCGSYHTLNTWTNVGAQNYAWATSLNTATDNFTHNGKWTVTVAKAWTYRMRLQAMFIPNADTSYGAIICPAINGTVNCGYNSTFGYNHRYAKAAWWSQPQHEFVFQLAAGNTVAWAYHPIVAMTYWAHDSYTALEITRIQ